MRKIQKIAIGTLLLVLTAGVIAAADMRRDFEWVQPLQGEVAEDSIYKFIVGGDIFAGCRRFPDDIRILDVAGEQSPFFLSVPRERIVTESVACRRLNLSRSDAVPHYWRQDLHLERPEGGRHARHNRLRIETSGSEFLRRVELLGSSDGEAWSLLGAGFLIRMNRPAHVDNRTIKYPASDFPYLQVRVYPDAREGLETFHIGSIDLELSHTVAGRFEEVDLAEVALDESDLRDEAQVFVYDTGFAGRPVERLEFDFVEDRFVRSVGVYGRDEPESDWRRVAAGEIHALPGSSSKVFELGSCAYRYLKLEVFHYDDAALTLESVVARAAPREIVFQARTDDSLSVYYGAEFVDAPRYDIERRVAREDVAGLPELTLGKALANEMHRAPGFGKLGPWLAAVVIGLVSIAVVKVIVDMLRRTG